MVGWSLRWTNSIQPKHALIVGVGWLIAGVVGAVAATVLLEPFLEVLVWIIAGAVGSGVMFWQLSQVRSE